MKRMLFIVIFLLMTAAPMFAGDVITEKDLEKYKNDVQSFEGPGVKSAPRMDLSSPSEVGPRYYLDLESWTNRVEYGYIIVEGIVTNISRKPLKNIEAVVVFLDSRGDLVTSDSALIEYNPILPRQSSPFKVTTKYNPAMEDMKLSFKTLMGGSIPYRH